MQKKRTTLNHFIPLALFFITLVNLVPAQDDLELSLEEYNRQSTQANKASHYYEVLIKDVLTKYYDDRTFLVDAKVYLNESEVQDVEGDLEGIFTLPGLPVLPKGLQGGVVKRGKSPTKAEDFTIKYVETELMVDTSYNEKDFDFIKRLVTMSANLNEYRGDKLEIRVGIFPVQKKQGAGYALAESMAKNPEPKEPDSGKSLETALNTNPFEPYVKNLGSLIPLLIILVFVLLIVIIIARAISKGKQKGKVSESYSNIISGIKDLKDGQTTKNEKSATSNSGGKAESSDKDDRELRSYLLSAFIGDTQASTRVLRKWLGEDAENGIEQAAKLIKSVDDRLLKVVTPELDKAIAQKLETKIKFMEPITPEDSTKILKTFKDDFSNLSSSIVNESEYADLFGFLRQMNEQQILHLLKEESEGIIGMVLAQIDPAKASSMIQKLEKSKRTKVLAGMGKIQNIPLNVYKELADRLSANALEVINMRYVASDGVESVLEVLESMPISVQSEYLNSIAEVDLNLAEKIKNSFITLPEVASLPDKFLSNAIRSMGQEILTNTLVGADDDLKNKVLAVLPERMQLMIKSGLETKVDLTSEEIEAAQKKFLQKIRQEIKAAGGRPESTGTGTDSSKGKAEEK